MSPLISIVIATYNSSNTLPIVLASIRRQLFDQKQIEILIVDGGSADETCAIARKFDCRIINNPKVEPLYAKYLGYMEAKGRYLIYIDHDEEMMNNNSLKERISVLKNNNKLKALTGSGYYSPKGYHIVNSYINEFGDPFSFFIYRLTKHADLFIKSMKSRYKVVKDTSKYIIFDISGASDIPLIELVAGGGMFDREYVKTEFPQMSTKSYLLPHILFILAEKSPILAIVKNDPIMHYSSDTIRSYFHKLIWRIKNNVFFPGTTGSSGFTGRQKYGNKGIRIKQLLFIPYALTIVLPLIDAVYLVNSRKNLAYFLHIVMSFVTAVFIMYFYILKIIGIKPVLVNYDGSVKAYENN